MEPGEGTNPTKTSGRRQDRLPHTASKFETLKHGVEGHAQVAGVQRVAGNNDCVAAMVLEARASFRIDDPNVCDAPGKVALGFVDEAFLIGRFDLDREEAGRNEVAALGFLKRWERHQYSYIMATGGAG